MNVMLMADVLSADVSFCGSCLFHPYFVTSRASFHFMLITYFDCGARFDCATDPQAFQALGERTGLGT
jgi:hypothetical protein